MNPRYARHRRKSPSVGRARMWRVAIGSAVGLVVVAAVVYFAERPPHAANQEARASSTAARPPRSATTSSPPTTSVPTTTTTDPGQLPQTDQFPSASTPQFTSEMQALWDGVVQGSDVPALEALFPQSAYVQLKTGLSDPAGDWTNRLVTDFGLDVQAAHQLIAADPSAATFVNVSVPEQYAHWIGPGICDNGVGYYEVANSRLVYQFQGQTRSFGIASMISWRGTWYVVHLGAILRPSARGMVEDPEPGTGTSASSSTC